MPAWLGSDPASVLVFMACVALAVYAQNLTGFAFGLILLGLVSVLHVASVSDAANAAMVLTLINAITFFRARPGVVPWKLMRPTMWGSALGVGIGVLLLGWLNSGAVTWLRALLGVSIIGCAVILLLQSRPRAEPSSTASFVCIGGVSGVLGGLFSSSGPPLVFHMYRQPLDRDQVRRGLLLAFAFNALVRLVLVLASGQFSQRSVLLCACAMPVVYLVTRFHHRLPHEMNPRTLQRVVATLLGVTGAVLVATALSTLTRGA